jgi:hypothetical protein
LGLVPVPGGARMTQIDILLCILVRDLYIVRCLVQMRRARHAGLSILNIETTRIANIPVCETFHQIGKRLLLGLSHGNLLV